MLTRDRIKRIAVGALVALAIVGYCLAVLGALYLLSHWQDAGAETTVVTWVKQALQTWKEM